jgi:Kdo2-lipid IVA lauroyltransferase/acyltransferase
MAEKTASPFSALGFRILILFIRLLPFRLMYLLSDALAWLLRKVIRYRLKTVHENLALTGMNADKKLMKKIYLNLSDIILEGLKSFSLSKADVAERYKITNPDSLKDYYTQGRSFILTAGHLANWEWGSLAAGINIPHRIIGFYKPLKDKAVNQLIFNSRAKFGTTLVPIKKTGASFEENKELLTVYIMIADQSPAKPEQTIWAPFMGRETAFLRGPEKYAILYNYPVIFCEIRRVKRGYYEVEFSRICNDPSATQPGEITALYAQKLENSINKAPHNWLWTHRRWKIIKP